jgi:hypothetical protein
VAKPLILTQDLVVHLNLHTLPENCPIYSKGHLSVARFVAGGKSNEMEAVVVRLLHELDAQGVILENDRMEPVI